MQLQIEKGSDSFYAGCILCGQCEFKRIPSYWTHSMTTAGKFVTESLSKAQCMSCGLLQRVEIRQLGQTDFYEKHYGFYERPGAAVYDRPRYRAMAKWIKNALNEFTPSTILDAGCGRGWMMQAMFDEFPTSSFLGIEPSEQENINARENGLNVIEAKIETNLVLDKRFDLIYSTNVVEHTTNPIDFLEALKRLLNNEGCIVLTCPDSSIPSAEFMFSDQNYSFTPHQLLQLAEKAGLYVAAWKPAPDNPSLRHKQLIILSKNEPSVTKDNLSSTTPIEELYCRRCEYVQSYVACDEFLQQQIQDCQNIYNFGTSTWSLLLSAYCPNYWQKVTACTIDKVKERSSFQGKPVRSLNELNTGSKDAFMLGVNPETQSEFQKKLAANGLNCIRWDHIISG